MALALPLPSLQTWALSICLCFKLLALTPRKRNPELRGVPAAVGSAGLQAALGTPFTQHTVSQNKSQSPHKRPQRPCSVGSSGPHRIALARQPRRPVPLPKHCCFARTLAGV